MSKKIEFLKSLRELITGKESKKTEVTYNGKKYFLEDLYQLTKEEESHVCVRKAGEFEFAPTNLSISGEPGYSYMPTVRLDSYMDITTGEEICYEGEEKKLGYIVKPMTQEEFIEFAGSAK
ncbi:MAG: hypothetical protein IJI60_02745 [Bacilli bacterium]|nr:hypothetical protein [Bacilli bacterium]